MTTDITELAQSLKAAAEKANPGPWRRASTLFNGIARGKLSLTKEDIIAGTNEKRDAEFIALANPANILALVEALEKAQETIAFQQGEIKALLSSLESRTVTVKLPPRVDSSNVPFAAHTWNCCLTEVEKRLTGAGIKVGDE